MTAVPGMIQRLADRRRALSVLAIDDEPAERHLLEALLAESGERFRLTAVGTLAEGIGRVKDEDVDAVLLDLSLPDSSGVATFDLLRREAPDVPIVVITGLTDPAVIAKAAGSGVQEYLVKGSFDGPTLGRAIRWAVERQAALGNERRLEEQLRRAQRLEAVGRLAGGIAHDFSNVLTAILLNADALARGLGAAHPLTPRAVEIRKASERASELISRLLAFGRKQIVQPRPVSLNNVVLELQDMLRRVIGEDVQVSLRLDPRLGDALADPGQLEQVILNLVVNARDAMPDGGELILETSEVAEGDGLQPCVVLAITDGGCGMDEATRARIFDPFFTTKEPGKGTGLGLATVHGIVGDAGGRVEVESEVGRGSTFRVFLPRLAGAGAVAASPPTAREDGPPGSESVLLVEDDTNIRDVLADRLRSAGYQVRTAARAAQALEMWEAAPGGVDLVLTDVVMPGMRGTELGRRVAERCSRTRVLYMSGHTDDEALREAVRSASAAFLPKPFDGDTLLRKVREVLDAAADGRRM